MDSAKLYAIGAFAAGLIVTLFLAAYLTPHTWWRRPNARALLIMVAGSWGFGSLILWAAHGKADGISALIAADSRAGSRASSTPQDAKALDVGLPATTSDTANLDSIRDAEGPAANDAGSPAPTGNTGALAASAISGQPFRVHRDLNLRAAASVSATRLGVVPAGATVTPTGLRHGDWWQIKARVDGHENTGWASSLWLRRSAE